MNPWFRYYHAALDHPKVGKLSDAQFRTWVGVLCVACRHDGALPPIADLAFSLRLPPKDAAKRIEALIAAGLVDRDGETLQPHDWNAWQFKSDGSTERVKRFRAKHGDVAETTDATGKEGDNHAARNVSATADETGPHTERNGTRNVPATATATGPDSDSETESSSSVPRFPARDDDDLLAKLKKAALGNIAPGCANVMPIRRLLAEGCELDQDVLAYFAARISKLKRPLDNFGNYWLVPEIHDWSRERRAAAELAASHGAPSPLPEMTFIEEGSPDWPRAVALWRRKHRKTLGPPAHATDHGRRGWYFTTALFSSEEGAKPSEAAE
jgi:hypothetical protein